MANDTNAFTGAKAFIMEHAGPLAGFDQAGRAVGQYRDGTGAPLKMESGWLRGYADVTDAEASNTKQKRPELLCEYL